jgi:peroxiredoxin
MNQLKSIYMLVSPMLLMAIIGISIYQMLTYLFDWSWVAVLLTALPLMVFLMDVMIFKSKPRTRDYLPMHTLIVSLGLIMILVLFVFPYLQPEVKLNTLSLILAELAVGIYIAYVLWYSSLGREDLNILRVGMNLPSFEVYSKDEMILSESFLGYKTVIIFYRGDWCPFCVAQIRELADQYNQLALSGVKFLLISPQPEKNTEALAKKFEVPFTFLSDPGNETATQLGINHDKGLPSGMGMLGYSADTVYPTVIVTDKKGKIIYLNETDSFRDRPDPDEYLNFLIKNK